MIIILKYFIFIIGLLLTVSGLIFIICYLNLLTIGYNFFGYVNFIIRRIECLNAPIGIIIMILSLTIKRKDETYELYL